MTRQECQAYHERRGLGISVVLSALFLYALAFALPVRGDEWGGGLNLFLLGGCGTILTLIAVPAQIATGSLNNCDRSEGEFYLLVACWLANPVFWYALWQSARGRWGRALVTSFLAMGLASIVGLMGLSKPLGQHEFWGLAYLAWWASMAWHCVATFLNRVSI
jgi:hypothetical protein